MNTYSYVIPDLKQKERLGLPQLGDDLLGAVALLGRHLLVLEPPATR